MVKKTGGEELDIGSFESTCGVGIVVDDVSIKAAVSAVIKAADAELEEEG